MSLTAQFNYPIGGKFVHLVVMAGEMFLLVYESFCIL